MKVGDEVDIKLWNGQHARGVLTVEPFRESLTGRMKVCAVITNGPAWSLSPRPGQDHYLENVRPLGPGENTKPAEDPWRAQ